MEASKSFKCGPSVSANSGLMHSQGDSLCAVGYSESFPQQQKNLNHITTVSSHQPPHSASSHQVSMGSDCLWAQNQYKHAVDSEIGCTCEVPQKLTSQEVMQQQQPQHPFKQHGHVQVSETSHSRRSPVTGEEHWSLQNFVDQQRVSSLAVGYKSCDIHSSYTKQTNLQGPVITAAQNCTPLSESPHKNMGQGNIKCLMPVQVSLMPSSALPDSSTLRKESPDRGSMAHSSSIQVPLSSFATPQIGQCPKCFTVSASPLVISCSESVVSPSRTTEPSQMVHSPLFDGMGFRHPQIPQPPLSQDAQASVIPMSVDNFLPHISTPGYINFTPPCTVCDASQMVSSPQKFSATSSAVGSPTTQVVKSSCLGRVSYEVEQQTKVSFTSSVSEQEDHTDTPYKSFAKTSQTPSVPCSRWPEKEAPITDQYKCARKQAAPWKVDTSTLNDTWAVDMSLAEPAYTDGPLDENMVNSFDNHIFQDVCSSMFIDNLITNNSRDMLLDRQVKDTCGENGAMHLVIGNSKDTLSLQDNTQMHNSLDSTSVNDTSVQISFINDYSVQSAKGSMLRSVKRNRAKSTFNDQKEEKVNRKKKAHEKSAFPKKKKNLTKEAKDMAGSSSLLKYHQPPEVRVVLDEKTKKILNNDTTTVETPRRRIATEEQVVFPLLHGWKREIRVRKLEDRMKGETWYYTPCGRRMKQFPEVLKYLKKHQDNLKGVTREHFSFSPRIPVGDFYEERDTPEGKKWFLLANEEVPSIIMAITGRRGRPPNPDKEVKPQAQVPQLRKALGRRVGRPPKPKMLDLLSKLDARLFKRLKAKEELSEEDKAKLTKINKKMRKKARLNGRKEKLRTKLQNAEEPLQESHAQHQSPNKEAQQYDIASPEITGCRYKASIEECPENSSPLKRTAGARSNAKALAKAQAKAEAQAQAVLAAKKEAERKSQAKRRLAEKKRQQMILEELRKPTEDMCLTDHTPLPMLSRIPGLVLSGMAFSYCITVVEFLHSFGKVLGFQVPKDIPSLATLQEGLLGISQNELLNLLIKLVTAALHDPGLPSYYQSVKILGEKLLDLELNHSTVSEVLRIFLKSRGFKKDVCDSLHIRSFQTLQPDIKASILVFLVEELNGSSIVMNEIDNTVENMTTYRKEKWIIERKLRKLKAALVHKTGRSKEDLCLEERRRSVRVGVAEDEVLENASGWSKDKFTLDESRSLSSASVPELERQIDKLTKRQMFFRKKLLQASHCMRSLSLGQDRYQRRYWMLPHIGGVLVEGPEELMVSEEFLLIDKPMTPVKDEVSSWVKMENTMDPNLSPMTNPTKTPSLSFHSTFNSSTSELELPGEASLMSRPRGRGRPHKIKPEVELHLRAVKNRQRRHRSKSVVEDLRLRAGQNSGVHDYTPSGLHACLEQPQCSINSGTPVLPPVSLASDYSQIRCQPEYIMKEQVEKNEQLNFLLMEPCKETSLSQPSPSTFLSPITPLLSTTPILTAEVALSQACSTIALRPERRCRRGRAAGSRRRHVGAVKRRGRPPSTLFQETEQKYLNQLIVKPIPLEMVKGWWWIKEPQELKAVLTTLHPRGIREKVLHKQLGKHMEFLTEFCTRPMTDPVFHLKLEEGGALIGAIKQPWLEQEYTMQLDISVLQLVEDLEHRVVGADLQHKMYSTPEPDSTRDDLQYHEHEVDPRDDWMVKCRKEWWDLLRVPTNPLDLAVLRLANLERNIERRYLKEPLWNLAEVTRLAHITNPPGNEDIVMDSISEITPKMRAWRQALERCRSASQISLCLLQLETSIAWEKSIIKVTCQSCRKGDNDECLLLCDGCDNGWHIFCLRPKVTQVPEGDWFCPTCISMEVDECSRPHRSARLKSKAQKRLSMYGKEHSKEDRHIHKNDLTSSTNDLPPKHRRIATRNLPDLTYCEIILMEMEAHADAWPFLEPVNPRLVPGYRRIIKNPMDFLTMRERLLQGRYCTCEEFAADAQLVFSNCELFNEDSSEVGKAGRAMRHFFENRWEELYLKRDK